MNHPSPENESEGGQGSFTGASEIQSAFNEVNQPQEIDNKYKTTHELMRALHPDWPPVKIHFHLNPHDTAETMASAEPHFKRADIHLYEDSGGSEESRYQLQNLAYADTEAIEATHPDFISGVIQDSGASGRPQEAILRMVYGSEKVVGSLDLDEHDPFVAEQEKAWEDPPYEGVYDEYLDKLDVAYAHRAAMERQREQMMVEQFVPEMERMLEEFPELKDKPQLTVLITIGVGHTTLERDFEKEGFETEHSFFPRNPVFNYRDQLMRTHARKLKPPREMIEKAFMESIIGEAIEESTQLTFKPDARVAYLRQTVDQVPAEDRRVVYERLQRGEPVVDIASDILAKNDLPPLPQAADEMDAIIAKRRQ